MNRILKTALKAILLFVGLIILYVVLGLALPLIGMPAKETPEAKTMNVYILTNGMHADLVLPIKTNMMDWSKKVPFSNVASQSSHYQWIAFGWGDKGFYLNTPTWADLKFSTAVRAAFGLSESAMHCTFYDNLKEDENCIKLRITENQYQKLVQYVDDKFDKTASGDYIFIPTDAVYGDSDAFYEAQGTYNLFYTCNTWANYGLKAAEQKHAIWTPTEFGIFRHYRK